MWSDMAFLSQMTCLHRFDEFKVRIAENPAFSSDLSGFLKTFFDPFSNGFP